ncbi:MAG: type II toxin-antitoxin system RelE/ParE family toxin [Planctomycetes bacterium]|nr:type II toxin-antitoxin system RelE/ParE family toxin [Planctomycetota bacterium]
MNAKRWSQPALDDIDAYVAYIQQDNRQAAEKWASRVFARGDMVARFPQSGRVVPEVGRDDVREVFVASHRLIYRVGKKGAQVLRVFHSARVLHESDLSEE